MFEVEELKLQRQKVELVSNELRQELEELIRSPDYILHPHLLCLSFIFERFHQILNFNPKFRIYLTGQYGNLIYVGQRKYIIEEKDEAIMVLHR